MSYEVFVDDNFHYMDEEHSYFLGEFETLEAAVAACQRVVNRCPEDTYQPGMSAGELMKLYCLFGDDPFIMDSGFHFSARDYASERVEKDREEAKITGPYVLLSPVLSIYERDRRRSGASRIETHLSPEVSFDMSASRVRIFIAAQLIDSIKGLAKIWIFS